MAETLQTYLCGDVFILNQYRQSDMFWSSFSSFQSAHCFSELFDKFCKVWKQNRSLCSSDASKVASAMRRALNDRQHSLEDTFNCV